MFTTVLVPLDGSTVAERALGPAVALASTTGSPIVLLRAAAHNELTDAQRYLEEVAGRLDGGEVEVLAPRAVETDWPAECIAEAAAAPGVLVCVSSHGASGIRRALLGSVAEDVLRMCATPVLIVGPEAGGDLALNDGRLVVCSDGSDTSEAILPVAQQWCTDLELAPWLTVVVDPEAAVEGPGAEAVEANYVRALATRFTIPGATTNWEVLHGHHPAEAIVGLAESLPATIVAMATHGKTGLARVALGSVAAGVVRHAPCPVLVLRPSDLTEG